MYNPEFDKKIDEAVANGQISEADRIRLHDEAHELGIDEEELDIVIDGRAYLAKHGLTYNDDLEVTEDTLTLTTDLDDEDEEESFVTEVDKDDDGEDDSEDEGFNFKKYFTLVRNNSVVRWLSIAALVLLCLPLLLFLLAGTASLFSGKGPSADVATSDSITVMKDTVAPVDTVKVLTEDEKIDSVRATLKGYNVVGVVKHHDKKHLVYYKGQTVYAYSTHQPEVAKADMGYRITDVAINPKTSNINVIVDSDPSDQIAEHYSMMILYMVYFFETYNDDDDGVFCQLECEEVGSGQYIEFVNKKTKIKLTTITGQTFDAEGNPDYLTEEDISDLY